MTSIIKAAKTGALTTYWFYPLNKKEVQLTIGLFSAFCLEIDDLGGNCVEEIRTNNKAIPNGWHLRYEVKQGSMLKLSHEYLLDIAMHILIGV
jgi:hypothetical protein